MSELNFTHSNGNKVKLTTPDTLAANRTFKLPGTDGSSGQSLVTDGSGALSFATPASTPGDTAPAFKAKLSSQQSAPSAYTFTKLQFANEVFDTNSCFDTTNHRFTPNVGGYYMITLGFSYANGNYSEATSILQIRKMEQDHHQNMAHLHELEVLNRGGVLMSLV